MAFRIVPTLMAGLLVGVLAACAAQAQTMADEPVLVDDAPLAKAARQEAPPLLDGIVLGDPAWAEAQPITGFWQTTPNEGDPGIVTDEDVR